MWGTPEAVPVCKESSGRGLIRCFAMNRLAAAIGAGDWRRALRLALAGWRKSPADELATLVDALSAHCGAPDAWPTARAAFDRAWHSRATKLVPEVVPALLANLGTKVFARPPGGGLQGGPVLARLAVLRRWPRDPRVAARLRGWIDDETARARDGVSSDAYLVPALKVLERQQDPRTNAWLDRYLSHNPARGSLLRMELVREAAKLRRAPPAPAADLAPLLSRLGAGPPTPARSGRTAAQLQAQVYQRPADLTLRAVLADAWLEQGEPRGELTALGLAALRQPLSPAAQLRHDALVRKHGKAWLGRLAPVVTAAKFLAGFADDVTLVGQWQAAARLWREAEACEELRTVRMLRLGKAYLGVAQPFFESAQAVSLEGAHLDSAQALGQLARWRCAPKLRRLSVDFRPDRPAAAHLKSLTKLERLELALDDVREEELLEWARTAPAVDTLAAEPTPVMHRSDLEARRRAIVAPARAVLASTSIRRLELGGWTVERAGQTLSLRWSRAPLWSPYEAWTLVAFAAERALKFAAVDVAVLPAALEKSAALRKALAGLRAPFSVAVG